MLFVVWLACSSADETDTDEPFVADSPRETCAWLVRNGGCDPFNDWCVRVGCGRGGGGGAINLASECTVDAVVHVDLETLLDFDRHVRICSSNAFASVEATCARDFDFDFDFTATCYEDQY